MKKTYADQQEWRKIQAVLPAEDQFSGSYMPKEEWWNWHGNNIHLDTFRNPAAKVKVVMLHGVGTNGRQISMIMGGPLYKLSNHEIETICIDMPTYGLTEVNQKTPITYDDWIQVGSDYIDHELSLDSRPIFIYGLSAGGMETYDVAAKNGKVRGIIGMTFLDQRNKDVQYTTTRNWFMGHVTVPLLPLSVSMGMGRLKVRMSTASKMSALCNDPVGQAAFMQDKTSAANSSTFVFLHSYIYHNLVAEPEDFDVCPILLTQPAEDRWTPYRLSQHHLDRVKKVPVEVKMLRHGGHYPVEPTALDDLHTAALDFIHKYAAKELNAK